MAIIIASQDGSKMEIHVLPELSTTATMNVVFLTRAYITTLIKQINEMLSSLMRAAGVSLEGPDSSLWFGMHCICKSAKLYSDALPCSNCGNYFHLACLKDKHFFWVEPDFICHNCYQNGNGLPNIGKTCYINRYQYRFFPPYTVLSAIQLLYSPWLFIDEQECGSDSIVHPPLQRIFSNLNHKLSVTKADMMKFLVSVNDVLKNARSRVFTWNSEQDAAEFIFGLFNVLEKEDSRLQTFFTFSKSEVRICNTCAATREHVEGGAMIQELHFPEDEPESFVSLCILRVLMFQ